MRNEERMERGSEGDTGAAGSAAEVLRVFFVLGLTSFGGPVAHLGYFRRELVERRRWIGEERYAELVALCQFIPGPASSQLGFALGLGRAGWRGALAAWLGFTLPSAVIMALAGLGIARLEGPVALGALAGLVAVAAAVVAHAVWSMARTLTPDLRRILIAVLAAAIALGLPLVTGPALPIAFGQPAAIALGAALGILLCRPVAGLAAGSAGSGAGSGSGAPSRARIGSGRAAVAALAILALVAAALPLAARITGLSWVAIADACFRAGALVFGGGHVVLPLLQAEPAIAGAVPPGDFLAGYGLAQAMPGPLFTFGAFLGAAGTEGTGGVAGGVGASVILPGLLAGAASLVAIFLPGMLLLLAALPLWERLRRNAVARAALAGANPAVVGILAAALVIPIVSEGITGPWAALLAVVCLVLLFVRRVPVWVVVLLGAVAGGALGWFDLIA